MIAPAVLAGRARYERRLEGWVDDAPGDALAHTVRVEDDERAVEVAAVAGLAPGYELRAARGRALRGAVAPEAVAGVATLTGARMVAGFGRRVASAVGTGPGAALLADAAIEVARLARQVTKLPPERAALAAGGDPWACWQLDTTAWADLPDSCFTYSAVGRARVRPDPAGAGARPVVAMTPDLYRPRPGQTRVFVRHRTLRLERTGGRLHLLHRLEDNVHGFELACEVDLATGTIAHASHRTPRLPYRGVCDVPQARLATLIGQRVDGELRRRAAELVGGPTGCAQLYDLVADLVRLLA